MDPLRNIPRLSELSEQLKRLSPTDHASFSKLTSVSDIQAWTTAKADEHRQFALALLAIHNLAAPIHRLSTEVLGWVFSNCWHDRKALRLSHVCSLWRSVILDRSALWADAAANWGPLFDKEPALYNGLPFADAVLSRSVRHPGGIGPSFRGFSPNIVKAVTPYIGNVVSLRVTLDIQFDLCDGLWPVLCSGMPKLNALHIELIRRVGDYRDDDCDEDELLVLGEWDLDEEDPLAILSCQNLPNLSRLTCPYGLLKLFGGVTSLKYVKILVEEDGVLPGPDTIDTPKRLLEPFVDHLETLEIMGGDICNVTRPLGAEALQLASLHNLRIKSYNQRHICAFLSWLDFPQTTHVHITDDNLLQHPLLEDFFSSKKDTPLHAVVASIDNVIIHCPPMREWTGGDSTLCFVGDEERLRMELYRVTPEALVAVFGKNANITRLELAIDSPKDSEFLAVDFRAFPHLVNLSIGGPDLERLVRMLGPTDAPKPPTKGRAAKRTPATALCPSLAELVITCGLTVRRIRTAVAATKPKPKGRAGSTRSASKIEPSTDVDKVLEDKCAILKQVLARRASCGTRLASLELRLHPATVLVNPQRDASGSGKAAGKKPAKPESVWPSLAARQSVIGSLDELVDGDVVFKLVDKRGHEVNVAEEDEA